MGIAVRYDIAAGEQLSSLLAQLNDKITALTQFRASQKSSDLDSNPGAWTGAARGQFDSDYAAQQSALGTCADNALTIKSRVDQANQQAVTLSHHTSGLTVS